MAPELDFYGADDGIRTRDPHLGKVMLYQLSHVRVQVIVPSRRAPAHAGARRRAPPHAGAWCRSRPRHHVPITTPAARHSSDIDSRGSCWLETQK